MNKNYVLINIEEIKDDIIVNTAKAINVDDIISIDKQIFRFKTSDAAYSAFYIKYKDGIYTGFNKITADEYCYIKNVLKKLRKNDFDD